MRANGSRLDTDLSPSASLLRSVRGGGMKTVILAGGKGTRLMPYTSVLPKPLMPLGDRAILELVVHQLARQGFVDITLSVGHLAHLIEAVFGNGERHSVDITYVREDVPLGTAGSLRLIDGLDDTFVVLNGDLVTTVDYRDLVLKHRASNNVITIAAKRRQVEVDYGVIDIEAGLEDLQRIARYGEKPVLDFMISMGIYVLEPEALGFIPDSGHFDFPDLVQRLLRDGVPVGAYVHDGLWLDIGRHEDYELAHALWEKGELASLWDGPPTHLAFNGTPASFTATSDTQITAVVSSGVASGPISVTTVGGTPVGSTNFLPSP
jgi:NDP-sugar pyrophosphorylase family protein